MATIRQLCTRCIVLDHGKVAFDGDVEEAIRVYLEQGAVDLKSYYDLKDTKRPTYDHGRTLHINSLRFLDKSVPSYKNDETVRFEVNISANADIDDIRMYYAVKNEEDVAIATIQSDILGSLKQGESASYILDMDISCFVEGKYSFEPDLYISIGAGAHTSYDHPMEPIYFEVGESSEPDTIFWQKKYFGSIRLNRLKVEENRGE